MTVECYTKFVWDLQCNYGTLMNKYTLSLKCGVACKKQLEKLKLFKRSLLILNRYDTRDIVPDTTDYNVLTFDEINCIITMLYKKC